MESTLVAEDPRASLLGVYRPAPALFVRGEGARLIDDRGRSYLDFTSGIAVNALGYGSPVITRAVAEALATGIVHTSNLFRTEPAEELASWLTAHSFADRVFFCNSGAEANEGAIKFARRWAREIGGPQKHEIVAFRGSFHGRTLGALAVTDRPTYREPFEPLPTGMRFCDPSSMTDIAEAIDPARTAAVLIEPIQAEGGVRPIPTSVLQQIREMCDAAGALLIFDEVQVGLGRTGRLWAHEAAGITPDMMTLAKPLAGGLPMGAVLMRAPVADAIRPGDHATTFGGGPFVASVALAVCRTIGDPEFLSRVQAAAAVISARLSALASRRTEIEAVRGEGLIWGVQVRSEAAAIVHRAMAHGLLLCTAGPDVLRFLPPLTIELDEIDEAVELLERSL